MHFIYALTYLDNRPQNTCVTSDKLFFFPPLKVKYCEIFVHLKVTQSVYLNLCQEKKTSCMLCIPMFELVINVEKGMKCCNTNGIYLVSFKSYYIN